MKLLASVANKVGGLLGAAAIRAWMATLDYQAAFYDRSVDPVEMDCTSPSIYLFWHENILLPIYLRGHNDLVMLLSQHRDADVLSRAAYHLGFDFVRGSTYRGSVTAVRSLLRQSRRQHLTITPDGPRGPRRKMAQGPIYLSSKLGLPLVVMGFGYDRPWRMRSWDRFAVPKPYSRARAVVSGRIQIPPNLDRDGIEYYRGKMETLLNRLTDEAGAWAEAGTRKVEQVPCRRQASPLGKRMELPMSYALREEDTTPATIALPRRAAG
jgi:lysophospholipid acyltransferase (LPLAT)-like uncharacterized protein